MHLINKKEKDMNEQERLELEIMRTLAVGRGFNLRNTKVDFDFRDGSNFSKMAKYLLKRFDISFRDKADEKKLWNESETRFIQEPQFVPPPRKKEEPVQMPITGDQVMGEEGITEDAPTVSQEASASKEKKTKKAE